MDDNAITMNDRLSEDPPQGPAFIEDRFSNKKEEIGAVLQNKQGYYKGHFLSRQETASSLFHHHYINAIEHDKLNGVAACIENLELYRASVKIRKCLENQALSPTELLDACEHDDTILPKKEIAKLKKSLHVVIQLFDEYRQCKEDQIQNLLKKGLGNITKEELTSAYETIEAKYKQLYDFFSKTKGRRAI